MSDHDSIGTAGDLTQQVDDALAMLDGFEADVNQFLHLVGKDYEESGNQRNLSDDTIEVQRDALSTYREWYSVSRPLVERFLPDVIEVFDDHDRIIRGRLYLSVSIDEIHTTYENEIQTSITDQKAMVRSIPNRVEIERAISPRKVASRFSGDELLRARGLLDVAGPRPAGAVAGVAVEQYLIEMCRTAEPSVKYDPNDTLSTLSQHLFEAGEISKSDYQQLQYFASIRGKCVHADEEEPTDHEVERWIDQAKEFIKKHGGP